MHPSCLLAIFNAKRKREEDLEEDKEILIPQIREI